MSRIWNSRVRVAACAFTVGAVLAAPYAIGAVGSIGGGGGSQPDVIVVMVDDLGAIDERVLDRLPNIRGLWLDQGLRFDAAYTETPLCCPSRAAFLTGQHTQHHGVIANDATLLDPSVTIATTLKAAGYSTTMVGKYLNNSHKLTDHTPPGWDRVAMLNNWKTGVSSRWWVQDKPKVAGHFDRFVLEQSVKWLKKTPRSSPMFMWVAPHGPHKAEKSPEWIPDVEARYAFDPRCDGIPNWRPPNYDWAKAPDGFPLGDICRALLTVDETVGAIQAQAAAQGRNPYWIFTSDNGMAWGADGYALKNVPQSGRMPLYIAGPGIARGSTDALISNIDVSPTIAALAGTSIARADGVSFAPLLFGGPGGRTAMIEDHPLGGATGRGQSGAWWGIRTPDWHYINWNGDHLYLTSSDRWELHDVARQYPGQIAALSNMKSSLLANQTVPAMPLPTPDPTATPKPTPIPTPSEEPTPQPTGEPTPEPTPEETATLPPSDEPTVKPSPKPTPTPTPEESGTPTAPPTAEPTLTETPTEQPTLVPSESPTPTDELLR